VRISTGLFLITKISVACSATWQFFGRKLEAKVLGGEHPEKYNQHRPHFSAGG
jgi:hypothetical protein